ncbi:Cyclin-L2 [Dermatophagoides farinae]|uniref:Cyclin-L2 n=1 Tax=Dermatophagoides farinae TaxID=6954 RepID=A0A922LBK8_DERFA|nr:Cyclin-L2 [Dermatophagoides farinae]
MAIFACYFAHQKLINSMETKNSSISSVIKNDNDNKEESNKSIADNAVIDGAINKSSSSLTDQQQSSNNRLKYGRVVILLENPILPKETILNTPSKADNLDPDIENDLRITGCKLIQISGILLRLPQVAMATGQVLFQRFYYSKSFVRQPMEITAMACVVLASKVEEAPRRIRDVINVFHNMKQIRLKQQTVPIILDENYIYLKNQVIKAERRILKELGFCVHVKHPHKFIVAVAQILKNESNVDLIQTAWSYMNDSLQTNVFVRYPPESIACACIHLSSRILKVSLPSQPLWYEMFNVDSESIDDICKSILMLYTRKPLDQEDLEMKVEQARLKLEAEKVKARALAQRNNLLSTEAINSPVLIDSRSNSPSVVATDIIANLRFSNKPMIIDGDEKILKSIRNDDNIMEISTQDSISGGNHVNQQQDNVGSEHSSISSSSSFKLQKSPIKSSKEETSKSSKRLDYDYNHSSSFDNDHYKSTAYRSKKNGHSICSSEQDDYYSNSRDDHVKLRNEQKEYRNDRSPLVPRSFISSKIVSSNSNRRDHRNRYYQEDSRSRSRSPISTSSSYCDNQYSSSRNYYYDRRNDASRSSTTGKNRSNDGDRRYKDDPRSTSSNHHHHQRHHNYHESPDQSSYSSRYYHKSSYSGKY